MIIDSHQHFWKFDPVRDQWITDEMQILKRDYVPGDLEPVLKRNNVSGTVAVQADQSEQETAFLIKLATENSFIKGVVGWVDLKAPDLRERLRYYKEIPVVKGFRHVVQAEPVGFLSDPRFIGGVRALAEFGFTYDLLIYHHQLSEALSFVAEVPEVRVVVDHLAKPAIASGDEARWKDHMTSLASFSNVWCKLSGMVTEASWTSWKKENFLPYLDVMFETFGPSRLMYGSDWPVCLLAASYDQQLDIVRDYIDRLSNEEKRAVLGENAAAFYQLY